MGKYRIYFDVKNCEGQFDCAAVAPELFLALPGGGKADLVGGTLKEGLELKWRDIEEADLDSAIEAAGVCPPQVIRVEDLDSGITIAGPDKLPIEKGEGIEQRHA